MCFRRLPTRVKPARAEPYSHSTVETTRIVVDDGDATTMMNMMTKSDAGGSGARIMSGAGNVMEKRLAGCGFGTCFSERRRIYGTLRQLPVEDSGATWTR